MKHYYFFFVLSLFSTVKSHSQNLVPNHSFEEYNYCPTWFTSNASQFDQMIVDWYVPFSHKGTSDYWHGCHSSYPNNNSGIQYAQHGQGYIGLHAYQTYYKDTREYAMVELISSLEKDVSYTLSMWVSLADKCEVAVNGIGMALLSDTQMQSIPNQSHGNFVYGIPYALIAQQPVSDKVNWVQLKTEYIANGDEKYVLLGNLLSGAQNTEMDLVTWHNSPKSAYYYIDNITVMKTSEYIASNKEIDKKSFTVYPNPATDIINIESENEIVKSIEIIDVNGKSIPLNSINNQTIDISSLANGVYFLKIKSNTGEEVHKIIKK